MKNLDKLFFESQLTQHKKILIAEAIFFSFLALIEISIPTYLLFWISTLLGFMMILFGFFHLFKPLTSENKPHSGPLDFIFGLENILIGIVFFLFLQVPFTLSILFISIMFLIRGLYFFALSWTLRRISVKACILGVFISLSSLFLFWFLPNNPSFTIEYGKQLISFSLTIYVLLDILILTHLKPNVKKMLK